MDNVDFKSKAYFKLEVVNKSLKEDNEKISIMWEEFNYEDKRSNIWDE